MFRLFFVFVSCFDLFSCLFRVSTWGSRVCIDIHETRNTKHEVFVFRVPNSSMERWRDTSSHDIRAAIKPSRQNNPVIFDEYSAVQNSVSIWTVRMSIWKHSRRTISKWKYSHGHCVKNQIGSLASSFANYPSPTPLCGLLRV